MTNHPIEFLVLKDMAHLKACEFNVYISIDITVECYKRDDPHINYRVYRYDLGFRKFRSLEKAIKYVEAMEEPEDE